MSVFRGSITEYPGVIVDHFVPVSCERGRVFFLSHCHRDHMTGLGSPNIVAALQKWNTNLLCSEVTQALLMKDPEFTQLAPYLRGLPMEEPIVMSLEASGAHEKLSFTVTLLPAGHCPGSSMFFFQGDRGNVLYTGDFRLSLEETKRLRPLHCEGSLLKISTLYVDTTFLHPIAAEIPSRDTSRDIVLKLIERWLAKDPANVVHLQCTSFGYEHIFMGIHQRFKTKIHIAPWKMNAYREISAVTDCLTTDGDSTHIHACIHQKGQKQQQGLPCGSCQKNGTPPNVLRVKPSTLWFLFNKKSTSHPCVFLPKSNKFRVIHSMHASFNELRDFITYIRPRRIVPCVVPLGDSSLSDVCTRLKGLLPQTEVSSGCVEYEEQRRKLKRSSSQKKSAEGATPTTAECGDDDSWSTGDESIDEFTSTEEPVSSVEGEPAVFTHTQSYGARLSLPSLIAVEDMKSSPPPSADSGATLGSLIQSPIDLSLTPSVESATTTSPPPAASRTNLSTVISSQPGQSGLSGSCVETESDNHLGLSGEERGEDGTPPSKRARLSDESCPMPRKLFTPMNSEQKEEVKEEDEDEEKEDEEEEENGEDCEEEEEEESDSPSNHLFIDLTEDEEDDTLVAAPELELIDLTHDTLTPPSPEPLRHREIGSGLHSTPRLSSPVEELSDSQTSGSISVHSQRSVSVESCSRSLGSPNCLPPTPGRENVHSILQRHDFP